MLNQMFFNTILFLNAVTTAPETKPVNLFVGGGGFFTLDFAEGRLFTRSLTLIRNLDGDLITQKERLPLMGLAVDPLTGSVSSTTSPVNIPNVQLISPAQTDQINFGLNLNACDDVLTSFSGKDFASAENSSHFSTAITAYDSLGNTRELRTYFLLLKPYSWAYFTLTLGENLSNYDDQGLEDGTVIIAQGTLQFNPQGQLISAIPYLDGVTGTVLAGQKVKEGKDAGIEWNSGAQKVPSIKMSFNKKIVTQYCASSSLYSLSQNGYPYGERNSTYFDSDGNLIATFSNGLEQSLYLIPLALFPAEDFLTPISDTLFRESVESGPPALGAPNTGGRGSIYSQ